MAGLMKIIDIHSHGIGGYDTKATSENAIQKIAELQGISGVSEIILSIYPSSIKEMRENMKTVRKAIELQNKKSKSRKAKILGIHLEGPFLNPSKCGSLSPTSFIEPNLYNLEKLIDGFEDIIRIITIAPELNGSLKLIKKASDKGIIVSMGHSEATYNEAEAGFHAGAKGITHIFNAMRGFHHREPGIAGFGIINQDIYIEIIADPYHLHLKTLEMIFKLKNNEKIIIISDSVKETKTSHRIQAIKDSKEKLLGGCMTVTESLKWLIANGFDEKAIMKCITKNPKRYLST